MYPLVGLWTEEKREKSCILIVKTSDSSISKDIFMSKLGKHNLKKITVYWVTLRVEEHSKCAEEVNFF